MKNLINLTAMCMSAIFFTVSGLTAQTTAPAKIVKGKYHKIVVAKFDVQKGVEKITDSFLLVLQAELMQELERLNKFNNIEADQPPPPPPQTTAESAGGEKKTDEKSESKEPEKPALPQISESSIRIVGTITKYAEGSRAARYIIGLGAGRSKVVALVKFLDSNNNVLLEKSIDGAVYMGTWGGSKDEATRDLAHDIASVAKKEFF